jgi:hypothetical protein
VKEIIIGYLTLEDVCNWNYDCHLSTTFLLTKTKHDYQDWIYQSSLVQDWKETHLLLTSLKERKARVVICQEYILHPMCRYPIQERFWKNISVYKKLRDLQLGDIVLDANNQLALVQNGNDALFLKNYGKDVLSGIPDIFSDMFFSLPLHFWSNVKEIKSIVWRLEYNNLVGQDYVCFSTAKETQGAFLLIFTHHNVSYGLFAFHHNVNSISVQYPLPAACWMYMNSTFFDLFKQHHLATDRIMMSVRLSTRLLDFAE